MVHSKSLARLNYLRQAGSQFAMREDSDYLFILRALGLEQSAAGITACLGAISACTSDNVVALLGHHYDLKLLIDLDGVPTAHFATLPLKDFSTVQCIALTPGVGRQLGIWQRGEKLTHDWWSAVISGEPERVDSTVSVLETLVLKPWAAGERHKDWYADLFDSGAEHCRALSNASDAIRQILVTHFDDFCTPRGEPQHYNLVWRAEVPFVRCVDVNLELISSIENEMSELLTASLSKPGEPDVGEVVDRIEDATRKLGEIQQKLADAAPSASEASQASSPSDPVRNAIEIREQLKRSVQFITSGDWARLRGISSNPAAALGKYKQARRVFAVRSGKRDLYPWFQFDPKDAEPLQVVAEILNIVSPEEEGWPLLSWFEAQNVLLGGKKPAEMLRGNPQAVLEAAARFYSRDD